MAVVLQESAGDPREAVHRAMRAIRTDSVATLADRHDEAVTKQSIELVWVTKRNTGSVAVIDPATNQIIDEVKLRPGVLPEDIDVRDGTVWVSDFSGDVYRIDPLTRAVVATIKTVTYAGGITARNGIVWVSNGDDLQATRIDVTTNHVAGSIGTKSAVYDVAMTDGVVWVLAQEGHLHRLAPTASAIAQTINVGGEPNALAGGETEVWASDLHFGRVFRIGHGGDVQAIDVGVNSPEGPDLAAGLGSVWVATAENNTIIRIDANSNQLLATIDLGGWVDDVAVGAGSVWAALPEDATVVRIDPTTNEVTARIRVSGFPNAVAAGR